VVACRNFLGAHNLHNQPNLTVIGCLKSALRSVLGIASMAQATVQIPIDFRWAQLFKGSALQYSCQSVDRAAKTRRIAVIAGTRLRSPRVRKMMTYRTGIPLVKQVQRISMQLSYKPLAWMHRGTSASKKVRCQQTAQWSTVQARLTRSS